MTHMVFADFMTLLVHDESECAYHRKGVGSEFWLFISNVINNQNYADWMKVRVASNDDKHIHSYRMPIVEYVFANIGTNKRWQPKDTHFKYWPII